MEARLNAWKRTMFQDFFSQATLTKDYDADESNKPAEQRAILEANRFSGYQKIILTGLGTMFWGTATGVISNLKGKLLSAETIPYWVQYCLTHWVRYCFIYGSVALVFMLLGLCASTFPSSSPLPAATAGLGSLQAFVFILGTFHLASLKHYSSIEECFYSFCGSVVVITFYWGFAAQDPLVLHIFVKSIWWVINLPFFAVCFSVYHLWRILCKFLMLVLRGILKFFSAVGQCICACPGSFSSGVSALFHLARGYQPAGQGQQVQP